MSLPFSILLLQDGILKGGSSCEDEFEGEKLCYVSKYLYLLVKRIIIIQNFRFFSLIASFSNCTDKTYSNRNIGDNDIWLNGPVYYSKLACQEENQKEFGKNYILKLRYNCNLVLKTCVLKF